MYIYHYTTVNKYPNIIYWVSLSNNFTHNHKYIDKAFMQYKFSLFFKQMVINYNLSTIIGTFYIKYLNQNKTTKIFMLK